MGERVMFALLDLLATSSRETLDIAGRAQPSLDEHERIVETLEARDPEAAREAMPAILFSGRRRTRRDITPETEG